MSDLLSIYWRDSREDALEWSRSSEVGMLASGTATLETLAREQAHNASEQIELWIGGEEVVYFAVTTPTKRRSLLKSAALYLAEEYLAQDVEQVHMAIGKRSEDGLLEICVLDRDRFADMIRRLSEHGLAPDRALPDYLGLVAAPDEVVMMLDPTADRALLRTGNLYFSQFAGLAGSPELLTTALVDHDMSETKQPALQIIGDVEAKQLEAMQLQLEQWRIQHSQPPKDMDNKLLVGQLQGRSAGASINLCSGHYKRKRKLALNFDGLKPLMKAAAAFAVVLTVSVLIKAAGLWWHSLSLQDESRQLYQAAFLDKVLSDEEIDHQLKTISLQGGETGIADFLYLFGMLSEAAVSIEDPNLNLGSIQYSYSNADLSVNVVLSDLGYLDKLNKALSDTGLDVEIASAQQREGGFVQAEVSLTGG